MTGTNSGGIERPSYFEGQILTAQDFADEQTYFREKLRRHNRLLHGWGVVCGLEVTPAAEGCAVAVSPGYALDPCGDEILLVERALLTLSGRRRDEGGQLSQTEENATACPDGVWYVAIRYAEFLCQLVPGIGEDDSPQPSRIRESFELRALGTLPAPPPGSEAGALQRTMAASGVCPPCPSDPDQRWIVLAEIRVRAGRLKVRDLKPLIEPGVPG